MVAFILVALSALLLLLVVWFWLRLRRKNQQQGESFAGKSTVSEQITKERRKA
jgi:membrane protein implicated in regulation of membrane protease activity